MSLRPVTKASYGPHGPVKHRERRNRAMNILFRQGFENLKPLQPFTICSRPVAFAFRRPVNARRFQRAGPRLGPRLDPPFFACYSIQAASGQTDCKSRFLECATVENKPLRFGYRFRPGRAVFY